MVELLGISVGIGGSSEIDLPRGSEHLIEHILFRPNENQKIKGQIIDDMISSNNGVSNGSTSTFETNYIFKFDIFGLDSFAEIFSESLINPAFENEVIKTEINNVNAEITMKIKQNKNQIVGLLLRQISNKSSPLFRDSSAELNIFHDKLEEFKQKLMAFHKQNYSANLIKIFVNGDVSHEKIKRVFEKNFGRIPNLKVERPLFDDQKKYIRPFSESAKNKVYFLSSDLQTSAFTIYIEIKSEITSRYFSPLSFFDFLIQYNGKDSFLETLKEKKLISSLRVFLFNSDYITSVFGMKFLIQDDFENKVGTIIGHFYSFVDQLKEDKDIEQFFKIYSKISIKNYFFKSSNSFVDIKSIPDDTMYDVDFYASQMLLFEPKHVLSGGQFAYVFDKEVWNDFLERLKSENPIIVIQSNKYKNTESKDTTFESQTQNNDKNQQENNSQNEHSTNPKESENDSNYVLDKIDFSDINNVILNVETEFNQNIKYAERLKSADWKNQIKESIPKIKFSHYPIIDSNIFDRYSITTDCAIPAELKPDEMSVNEIDSGIEATGLLKTTKKTTKTIQIPKMLAILMEDSSKTSVIQQQLTLNERLHDLKRCLKQENELENILGNIPLVFSDVNFEVYHKLYRKTLQEENILYLKIESTELKQLILRNDFSEKRDLKLKMELFAAYVLSSHQKLNPEFYLKGNGVSISTNLEDFMFIFSGITKNLNEFIPHFFAFVKNQAGVNDLELSTLENLKIDLIKQNDAFKNYGMQELIDYYFYLSFNRYSVDISDKSIFEKDNSKIAGVNFSDFDKIKSLIFENPKVIIFGVGNLRKLELIELAKELKSQLPISLSKNANDFADPSYMEFERDMSTTQITKQSHYLIELENPIPESENTGYATYFDCGRVTFKTRFVFSVLQSIINDFFFQELRVKRNFGYVANAFFKVINDVK